MATKRKIAPPQLATSPVRLALESIEFAKAVQDPDFSPSGYPMLCQKFIDNPDLIHDPLWTDVIVKILKQHVAEHPVPVPGSPEVAFMVEHETMLSRSSSRSREDVIAEVALATDKSCEAVEKALSRYGKRER